jgi:hypothetical protein
MVAARTDLDGLPGWPRGLSLAQAAAYVGVSPPVFMSEVDQGKWPRSESRGRKGARRVWDRKALDLCYDRASGLAHGDLSEDEAIARLA